MSINFDETLEKLKPIYYHLLDGFLNPNIGDYIKNTINFVTKKLNSDNSFNSFDINFITIKPNYPDLLVDFTFTNINKSIVPLVLSKFNLNEINEGLNNIDFGTEIKETNEEKQDLLLKKFKYSIYQITHNEHSTSMLFFQTCLPCNLVHP